MDHEDRALVCFVHYYSFSAQNNTLFWVDKYLHYGKSAPELNFAVCIFLYLLWRYQIFLQINLSW